jgi:hypothetical protein
MNSVLWAQKNWDIYKSIYAGAKRRHVLSLQYHLATLQPRAYAMALFDPTHLHVSGGTLNNVSGNFNEYHIHGNLVADSQSNEL